MRYVFTVILFLITQLSIVSGQTPQLVKVIPPSPNTASLGKYGDIPIGLYTGIPQISLPIYEIKDGELDLPISISYHAGGVKVEEIPSSVGLGWTLIAGGMINRRVRGLPDEVSNTWFPQSPSNTIESIWNSGNGTAMDQLKTDVDRGYRDAEADIYSYNVNGKSGGFFFDQAGVIHSYPAQNILVAKTATAGWKLTVENGTVYTFEKREEVSSSGCGDDNNTVTAWYLTSIKSSDGKKEITFTYDEVWVVSSTLLTQVKYFPVYMVSGVSCASNLSPCVGTNQDRMQRLKRIDFSDGYVNFIYNNVRCDLVDDKSLDQIEVYTKNNQLLKRFNLAHSYFGDNSDGVNRLTENNKRLKLLSLTEQTTALSKPPVLLEYEESIQLPNRLSYAQDHWGYYNAKNNTDLVSTFIADGPNGPIIFPGADRKANAATTQAAILKKIKYPTGGETLFTYENNTVSDNRADPDYTETYMTFNASNTTVSNLPNPYMSQEMTIPNQGAIVQFTVSGLDSWPWQSCDIVQCQVIKDNNYSTPFRIIQNSLNGSSESWPAGVYRLKLVTQCGIDAVANFNVYVNAKIITEASFSMRTVGGLRLKQIEDKPLSGAPSVIKNYRYHIDNTPTLSSGVLVNFPIYGYDLRMYCTQISQNAYTDYKVRMSTSNYPLCTTQGSYVGYSHVIEDLGDNGETRHSFIAYENFLGGQYPNHPGTGFPFAPIETFDWRRGFETNKKIYAKKNNQLVLVKEFINTPFDAQQFTVYGLKTGKYVVDAGSLTLYQIAAIMYPTITKFFSFAETKERTYDQNDPTKYIESVTNYSYNPQHFQLAQTISSTSRSDQTTIDEVVVNKKYPQDYVFTGAPSGSEASGIKKLQDLHIVGVPIEEYTLRQSRNSSNNQLSNQRITKSTIATYKIDNPYPDQIYSLETNTPLPQATFGSGSGISSNSFIKSSNSSVGNLFRSVVQFNSYDNYGNLTMQQKANDVQNSFIWDYNNLYPIAEITGADVASTAYTSFEADGTGGWTFSGLKFIDGSAPTGKKVYNLNSGAITKSGLASQTYIVSYWSKSGAQTVSGSAATTGRSVNGWTYYEHKISVSGGTLVIAGSGIIDELRLYPDKAMMTTYTYDPLIGTRSQCDPNNRIIYYEYDEFGRLILTRDQDKNILKKICYNYTGQTENCNIYYNILQGSNFTKNDCPPGFSGSMVGYNIPANAYSSTISVADANAKALADVFANGQAYANATGTCTASCSFSMGYGFSNYTSSISLTGSTASFYIVFAYNSTMDPGNTYFVATINGSCRPSVTRTINYSTGGRNWTITIYPSGQMYWYLQYGSSSVPAYSAVGTGTINYNL